MNKYPNLCACVCVCVCVYAHTHTHTHTHTLKHTQARTRTYSSAEVILPVIVRDPALKIPLWSVCAPLSIIGLLFPVIVMVSGSLHGPIN